MKPVSLRAGLMAGAALLCLMTPRAFAEYSSLMVFGDAFYDTGQYVDPNAVFNDNYPGDGRLRRSSRDEDGVFTALAPELLASRMGLISPTPSQPQVHANASTPASGYNYAAAFHRAQDVRDSIVSWSRTSTFFVSNGAETVELAGSTRRGVLADPDRAGAVRGALALVGGGAYDVRDLADIDIGLGRTVDLDDSGVNFDPVQREAAARNAAGLIAEGASALANAGAGVVVVSNLHDIGDTPEDAGDLARVSDADAALTARETEAQTAADFAAAQRRISDASQAQSVAFAATAAQFAQAAADAATAADAASDNLEAVVNGNLGDNSAQALAENAAAEAANSAAQASALSAQQQALTAANSAQTVAQQAAALDQTADAADVAAAQVALTAHEIALRAGITAIQADSGLMARIRTEATDDFNNQLVADLAGAPGNLLVVDRHALIQAVIANPEFFGFSAAVDQSATCAAGDAGSLVECVESGVDADQMLFHDGAHFTQAGNQLLADQIGALLSAPAAFSATPYASMTAGRSVARLGKDQASPKRVQRAGWAPFVSLGATAKNFESKAAEGDQSVRYLSGLAGISFRTGDVTFGGGLGYQNVSTNSDTSALKYNGDGLFGVGFLGADFGPVFASGSFAVGQVDYDEIERRSHLGAATIANAGSTEAMVYGGSIEAGARAWSYDSISIGPVAALEHWSSDVDGYAENGWGVTAVSFSDVDGKSTRGSVGAFLEAGELASAMPVVFRTRIGYSHEFHDGEDPVSATPLGGAGAGRSFTTTGRGPGDGGFELGAELIFAVGDAITTIAYDARFQDDHEHSVRLDVAAPF